MATTSPNPFPADGQRKLTTVEALQRAKALSCTLPKDTRPTCSGQVFVGIFFDGTGNNMHDDYEVPPPEKRKHSNIVKLFLTYKNNGQAGYFRNYIPGVGTPFPEIGDKNTYLFNKNRGSIAGERGEEGRQEEAGAAPRVQGALARLLTGRRHVGDGGRTAAER